MKKRYMFWFAIGGLIVVLGIPVFFNFVIINNGVFSKATNDGWIAFMGSYYGSILGGLATLGGVLLTLKKNSDQTQEEKRLEYMPYLTLYTIQDNVKHELDYISYRFGESSNSVNDESNITLYLYFINAGNGTAFRTTIKDIRLGGKLLLPIEFEKRVSIMRRAELQFEFLAYLNEIINPDIPVELTLEYYDIFENQYHQEIRVTLDKEGEHDYKNEGKINGTIECGEPKLCEKIEN